MEKVLKSKYYSLIVMAIMFFFWLICYLQYDKVTHVASNYLITFESIEGKGTTFTILIPQMDGKD